MDNLERSLERLAAATEQIAQYLSVLPRLADVLAPAPVDVVGTVYVAQQLGCTTVWISEMARKGTIPRSCIVPGTGNGKPWKFYRERIDEWLTSGRR